jgi:hypothetical protein
MANEQRLYDSTLTCPDGLRSGARLTGPARASPPSVRFVRFRPIGSGSTHGQSGDVGCCQVPCRPWT